MSREGSASQQLMRDGIEAALTERLELGAPADVGGNEYAREIY